MRSVFDSVSLSPQPSPKGRGRNKGSGLVVALVTLLVVTSIMGSIMHALLSELRQTRQTIHEVQAQWLADAAVARAASRLVRDRDYAGETWQIDLPRSSSSPGERRGSATIQVERGEGAETARIKVHVNYPEESPRRVSAERAVSVSLNKNISAASDSRKETNE
jgi:Tfp pilus assembly protein PilV